MAGVRSPGSRETMTQIRIFWKLVDGGLATQFFLLLYGRKKQELIFQAGII
jgi:hypothetical protein